MSTATLGADAETAEALGLEEGELVLELLRVRLADERPISLERARFPAARFPGLLDSVVHAEQVDFVRQAT